MAKVQEWMDYDESPQSTCLTWIQSRAYGFHSGQWLPMACDRLPLEAQKGCIMGGDNPMRKDGTQLVGFVLLPEFVSILCGQNHY